MTAAHDVYPLGITVSHGGKTWENLTQREHTDSVNSAGTTVACPKH